MVDGCVSDSSFDCVSIFAYSMNLSKTSIFTPYPLPPTICSGRNPPQGNLCIGDAEPSVPNAAALMAILSGKSDGIPFFDMIASKITIILYLL
jgi:hypothetical protein